MYPASAMVDRAIRITLWLCPLTLVGVVGPVAIGGTQRSDGVVTCALVRLRPEEHPERRETRTQMLSILMGRGGPRGMGVSKCWGLCRDHFAGGNIARAYSPPSQERWGMPVVQS